MVWVGGSGKERTKITKTNGDYHRRESGHLRPPFTRQKRKDGVSGTVDRRIVGSDTGPTDVTTQSGTGMGTATRHHKVWLYPGRRETGGGSVLPHPESTDSKSSFTDSDTDPGVCDRGEGTSEFRRRGGYGGV